MDGGGFTAVPGQPASQLTRVFLHGLEWSSWLLLVLRPLTYLGSQWPAIATSTAGVQRGNRTEMAVRTCSTRKGSPPSCLFRMACSRQANMDSGIIFISVWQCEMPPTPGSSMGGEGSWRRCWKCAYTTPHTYTQHFPSTLHLHRHKPHSIPYIHIYTCHRAHTCTHIHTSLLIPYYTPPHHITAHHTLLFD